MSESVMLFCSSLLGAVAMGVSCGTGCSPAISMLLSSYIIHAEGDRKKSVLIFTSFFLGKGLAILSVCVVASVVGTIWITRAGYLDRYSLEKLLPLFLLCSGLYMLVHLRSRKNGKACHACGHCSGKQPMQQYAPLLGGFVYGLTPCAPLVMLAGYAVSMQLWQSIVLGTVFSLSCMLSPMIVLLICINLITNKVLEDMPELFFFLQLLSCSVVIVMGLHGLLS